MVVGIIDALGFECMELLYVLYELIDGEPQIIGLFDDRERLRQIFPSLEGDRFQIGFTLKPVVNSRVEFWGKCYDVNVDYPTTLRK